MNARRLITGTVAAAAVVLLAMAVVRTSAVPSVRNPFAPPALQSVEMGQFQARLDPAVGAERIHDVANVSLIQPFIVEGDQAFFGDFEVEGGEVVEGDVVIADGDARIKGGGRVSGDLVVYSGDVQVDGGGIIEGSVFAVAGDVKLMGRIGGDLTVWSGDVELKGGAEVAGDIFLLDGEIDRDDGAAVGGDIVQGPNIQVPPLPDRPFRFSPSEIRAGNNLSGAGTSFVRNAFSFVFRLMGAMVLALLVGLAAWLIAQARPAFVSKYRGVMLAQPALSFIVGLVANVVLLVSGTFFAATVCLIPLSVVVFLLFIGLNIVGWTVIASAVSGRLLDRYSGATRPDVGIAVAAAVLAVAVGLLWAMGSCFRFFGLAGMLVVASIGVGSILLPFLRREPGSAESRSNRQTPSAETVPGDDTRAEPSVYQQGSQEPGTVPGIVGVEVEEVSAEERTVPEELSPDDFTKIRGVGPVAASRLQAAGVTTYSQLAGMTAEAIGEILQWSPSRVLQSNIVGQAADLADSLN